MSKISTLSARDRLLEAALDLFAHRGFHRVGMSDIAKAAGLSRPTLYGQFPCKAAVFEALAERVVTRAIEAAKAAWRDDATLASNLEATILAKDLPLYRQLHATPHGAELLNLDADLTARQALALDKDFAALIAKRLEAAAKSGQVSVVSFGGAKRLARHVVMLAAGLKTEARDEADYRRALKTFVALMVAALTTRP